LHDAGWIELTMFATGFVTLLIVGIFAYDFYRRWRRDTEWKRRLRDRGDQ